MDFQLQFFLWEQLKTDGTFSLSFCFSSSFSFSHCLIDLFRYPYNWKKPIVYLFTSILFAIGNAYMYMVYVIFVGLFFGVCRFFLAFAADLQVQLCSLENVILQYASGSANESASRRKMQRIIREFVAFHADVKQLSCPNVFHVGRCPSFLWPLYATFPSYMIYRLANEWDIVNRTSLILFFYMGGILWCVSLYDLHVVSGNYIRSSEVD